MIIVGNKCELEDEREISKEEGEALVRSFGYPFIETSPRKRVNVENAFDDLVREIRRFERSEKEKKLKELKEQANKMEKSEAKLPSHPSGSLRKFIQRGRSSR